MKKITVVTVSYNAAGFLEKTIESVVGQSYPNLEYIIIDGASTDGTLDIIKKYSGKIAYWVSEPDKGIYDAMNKGILAATGDYIIFMNAGDRFAGEKTLEDVASKLNGATIVSGRWHRCYPDGLMKTACPKKLEVIRREMPVCHQATFVRTDYHKSHLFDSSYRFSADYAFFYRAWRVGEAFSYVDDVVADFLEEDGVSAKNIADSVRERKRAWSAESNLAWRKLDLEWQILRIKVVKAIKSIIKK